MNTISTVNRCTQLSLLSGAVGWILSRYVHVISPPYALSHAEFLLTLFCVGLVPTVTIFMPTLYPDPAVQRTSLWFAGITITALLTIATVLHFAFAAVGTIACMAALGIFYFLKQRFIKALRAR